MSKTAAASKPNVIPFFGRGPDLEDEPEVTVRMALSQPPMLTVHAPNALDLTGKPKLWFLIGPGSAGKTFFARWLGWQMQEAGRSGLMAALDPQNRSLASWFDEVQQPTGNDGAQSARWLRELLKFIAERRYPGMIDFGGGDTALLRLIEAVPDLTSALSEAGVEPVACYMLTPRQDDLSILGGLEGVGFKPEATLLVMNEGRTDSTISREEAFARVRRHSSFKSAVARGAVPIWMPRLEPEIAAEIEGKRLTFGQARDGLVPDGAKFAGIGGMDRSMVRRWLDRVDGEFAPVRSWML